MTWLVDTLIATGALIALVLVLRRPVARWFGPGMAYALWALPLLRLVLPPLMLPAAPASPDAEIIVL
ncbi:MAG TPA: M56 family metallopeptidase, partial [Novosphingobium sp.]|nr:M56 family metallopeptidase [Novosphingobium sp.]